MVPPSPGDFCSCKLVSRSDWRRLHPAELRCIGNRSCSLHEQESRGRAPACRAIAALVVARVVELPLQAHQRRASRQSSRKLLNRRLIIVEPSSCSCPFFKFFGHHIYFGLFPCNLPILLYRHLRRRHIFCQQINVWYPRISKEDLSSEISSFAFRGDKYKQPQFFRNLYKMRISNMHKIIQIVQRRDSTMNVDVARLYFYYSK